MDALFIMTQKRFRHLPVIESGKVVGIISIGDVVKTLLKEYEHTIAHLEDFIQGRYSKLTVDEESLKTWLEEG